ncbi:unnamed protein product, partial [Closterium sp. NIES-54]
LWTRGGRRRTGRRRGTKNMLKERNEVRPSPCSDSRTSRVTSARVLRTSSSSKSRVLSTSSSSNARVPNTSSSSNARLHSTSSGVLSTSSRANARVLSTSSSSNVQLHSTSSSTSARVLSTSSSSNARVRSTSSSTSSTRVRDTRRATPKSAAPLVPLTDLVTGGELPARRRSTSPSPSRTPGSRGTSPEAAVL